MPRSNPSRPRRRNRWRVLSPEELHAQAAEQRAQGAGGPLPWQPHPSLVALQDRLQLVADCWNLLDGTGGQSRRCLYLPQGSKEPEAAYRHRLANARPSGFFRDALRTYAGMLASVQWRELPGSLAGVLSDVDGLGTDLGVFLFLADLLVLRDGGALVLVLPAEHRWPSEGHRQEAIRRGDRLSMPRLALVPRRDCLDWQLANGDGLPQRIRWCERSCQAQAQAQGPDPRLASGVAVHLLGPGSPLEQPESPQDWIYREALLQPGGLQLSSYRAVASQTEPAGYRAERIGRPLVLPGQQQLPAVWYAADGAAFGEGDLPHLGLANQYLNHYRLKSDYEDLLSRCALPVGVRTGLVDQFGYQRDEDGAGRQPEQLTLSTSTFMDLPEGADFQWKEIRAQSLAEHRAYLTLLDETMHRNALVPTQNRGAGRSDSEISLCAGQAYALLQSLATQKSSIFSSLLGHWCRQSGETLAPGAGISLTVTPMTPPVRPQPSVAEWLELEARDVISRDELRQQLAISASPGQVNTVGQGALP